MWYMIPDTSQPRVVQLTMLVDGAEQVLPLPLVFRVIWVHPRTWWKGPKKLKSREVYLQLLGSGIQRPHMVNALTDLSLLPSWGGGFQAQLNPSLCVFTQASCMPAFCVTGGSKMMSTTLPDFAIELSSRSCSQLINSLHLLPYITRIKPLVS